MPLFTTLSAVHYSKVLLYTGSTPGTLYEDVEILRPYFTGSSYIEVANLRELPEFGQQTEVSNFPVFGSKVTYPVFGQASLTPMQFQLNFVPTQFQAGSALRTLLDTSRVTAMAIVMLPTKVTNSALIGANYGTVGHAVYYSWGGLLDLTVSANRTDAATANLTWQPVSSWIGPDQIELSDT